MKHDIKNLNTIFLVMFSAIQLHAASNTGHSGQHIDSLLPGLDAYIQWEADFKKSYNQDQCARTVALALNNAQKNDTYEAEYAKSLALATFLAYERDSSVDQQTLSERGKKILEETLKKGRDILAKEKEDAHKAAVALGHKQREAAAKKAAVTVSSAGSTSSSSSSSSSSAAAAAAAAPNT